jgi:hypothetical protein
VIQNGLAIQMTYSFWDGLKDFLGALGPLLIALPWFSDFVRRKRWKSFSGVRTLGALTLLKNGIESSLREKIDAPKAEDLIWTILGLLMIFLSFAIAFTRGIGIFG